MDSKERAHLKMISDMHHDLLVTMQAALIEWQHGQGAEAALQWIVNTLAGPGLLPDPEAPWGKDAQAFMSANRSDPMPTCHCGRPSHIGWMGKGFCSDEHYDEARRKAMQ